MEALQIKHDSPNYHSKIWACWFVFNTSTISIDIVSKAGHTLFKFHPVDKPAEICLVGVSAGPLLPDIL